jgi:hypothetical protein
MYLRCICIPTFLISKYRKRDIELSYIQQKNDKPHNSIIYIKVEVFNNSIKIMVLNVITANGYKYGKILCHIVKVSGRRQILQQTIEYIISAQSTDFGEFEEPDSCELSLSSPSTFTMCSTQCFKVVLCSIFISEIWSLTNH